MNSLPLEAAVMLLKLKMMGADFQQLLSESPDNGTIEEQERWIVKMETLKDRIIENSEELHNRWPDHFPPVPEELKQPTPGIQKVTVCVKHPVMTATDEYGNTLPLETLAN